MKSSKQTPIAQVAPLTIGAENAAALIGRSWGWCLETARQLGVPVIEVRRRPVIPAADFLDALRRAGKRLDRPEAPPPPLRDEADILERLGLEMTR